MRPYDCYWVASATGLKVSDGRGFSVKGGDSALHQNRDGADNRGREPLDRGHQMPKYDCKNVGKTAGYHP